MKRLALVLLLLAAAMAVTCYSMAPPERRTLVPAADAVGVSGAIHVHTRRSDGTGSVEQVAAAAAAAGLRFVVFTDHGDAAREPVPPQYTSGVLCIDAVEISTDGGHVVALGLPRAPYPLGGEPRDVVDDIARLGGMSIVAHPGSPKPELRWLEWTAPFDGLEWLNGDSEWRDEPRSTLARTLLTYPFRRAESIAALMDRPEAVLARWNVLAGRRRVVAVAGADAHARLLPQEDGWSHGVASVLNVPSYEQLFRAFSISAVGATLTGDAKTDAEAIIAAIRAGRVYSSIDGLATPAHVAFTASARASRAGMGETFAAGLPTTFDVVTNAPPGARITLLKDGEPLLTTDGRELHHETAGAPGAFRVEVHLPGAPGDPPVPWILTNPIYVQASDAPQRAPDPRGPPTEFSAIYDDGPAADARIENSASSQGALDVVPEVGGTQLSLRYALGGRLSESPYVALALPAGPGLSGYDRLMFTGRASTPMRVSVQLRVPQGPDGERWHRSVYLDATSREIAIPFDDMTPRGPTTQRRPPLAIVRDLLFVIDTVNTRPGASGQLWLDDIRYAR